MLKIGVLGVGYLGKIHLKCLQMLGHTYQMVGFYDPNDQAAAAVAAEFGVQRWHNPDELLDAVDVVDIVTPTTTHYEMAAKALSKGKHIFIEKPLTHTLEEADELMRLYREKGVKVQVGHVERFNPALLALGDFALNPMFVEAHRLAVFNPRGADVSVILDLMIHDLDILLSLVKSPVKQVSASGVAVVSDSPDIGNARIEFENGCVANLTASRISLKQMRKLRLFQKDAYISLDFLEKQAQVVRLSDENTFAEGENTPVMELETAKGKKYIQMSMPEIQPVNAIKMELESFASSITRDERPVVSIEDGYSALKLAYRINEDMDRRLQDLA
ncbi:MAG TPA: Gfo/Idh/MocA family oxidoreductase [Saprospiraceae bacterium]|nr:Gfo/Idh/MocA family oxidoreductase [Saprospiraceae bacterium]HMQ81981.1 Gfo/Idh/MocA family oxidoreductase [Saprospiraceae bacterium]